LDSKIRSDQTLEEMFWNGSGPARALFRALSNVTELATESIVLLVFGISECMDTGAAGVQSIIAVKLYFRDMGMKMMDDFANEVCVCNRKSYRRWSEKERKRVDENDEKV
jgi:hypothetical protein